MKYQELIKTLETLIDEEGLTQILSAMECIHHDRFILTRKVELELASKVLYEAASRVQRIGV